MIFQENELNQANLTGKNGEQLSLKPHGIEPWDGVHLQCTLKTTWVNAAVTLIAEWQTMFEFAEIRRDVTQPFKNISWSI